MDCGQGVPPAGPAQVGVLEVSEKLEVRPRVRPRTVLGSGHKSTGVSLHTCTLQHYDGRIVATGALWSSPSGSGPPCRG